MNNSSNVADMLKNYIFYSSNVAWKINVTRFFHMKVDESNIDDYLISSLQICDLIPISNTRNTIMTVRRYWLSLITASRLKKTLDCNQLVFMSLVHL